MSFSGVDRMSGKSAANAIGGWQEDEPSFAFKVSDIAYEMLKEQPGLRPAPYLASRGMKWIQHFAKPGLSDAGLQDYIRESHAIVPRRGCRRRSASRLGWYLGRNETQRASERSRMSTAIGFEGA